MAGNSTTTDASPAPLDPTDVRALMERVRDSFDAKDLGAYLAVMQPDVELHHVAAPAPLRGHDAVRAFYADGVWPAFSDMHLALVDGPFLHPDAPHLVVAWEFGGIHSGRLDPPGLEPTGRAVSILVHERWHVRDGRLAKAVVLFDVAGLLRQIGALPASGSGTEALLMATQNLRTRVTRLERLVVRHE